MRWERYLDKRVLKEDIEIIKNWLKLQPHLPDDIDDLIIGKFLTRCTSIQHTKSHIDHYFTMRHYAPELFQNRDPTSPNIRRLHSNIQVIVLPKLTKDGTRIAVSRMLTSDPNNFWCEDTLKFTCMVHDFCIATEPDVKQDIWVIDMQNASLSLLPKITLSVLRKFLSYGHYAQPLKVYQTHMINAPTILDKLVNLFKHMLTPAGQKVFYVHRPNTTTLFDFVSREDLPVELGGTGVSLEELHKEQIRTLEENRDFFVNEKIWEIDESKRPGGAAPRMDEGSFKSLSFD